MYIRGLSNRGIHATSILTKYLARNNVNFTLVPTLVDSEKLTSISFVPMANLSVSAAVIPDGVETRSGVSSSVNRLTTMVTNYLAPILSQGSLTPWTEVGQSSLVGSVENLASNRIPYSVLPALQDLFSGSYLSAFSLRLHLVPTCPLWMHPIHLLAIVSYLLHTLHVFIRERGLTFVQRSCYFSPTLPTVSLQVSVT